MRKLQRADARDDPCRKIVALLSVRDGGAPWSALEATGVKGHTLQKHLKHLLEDKIIVRDPPQGGRGVRGRYLLKTTQREVLEVRIRASLIRKDWTRRFARLIDGATGNEAQMLVGALNELEAIRRQQFATHLLGALHACARCTHPEDKHEVAAKETPAHCNQNVAVRAVLHQACPCIGFKPDVGGEAAARYYFGSIRELGVFTDDVALHLVLRNRHLAAWAREKR
jgi:hypothetical protein